MGRKADDIIGRRFGRLIVIDRRQKNAKGRFAVWNCKCDCGTEWAAAGRHLKSGAVRSCGCLRREVSRSRMAEMHSIYGYRLKREEDEPCHK